MGVVKRKKQKLDSLPPLESEDFARRCKDNIKNKHLNVLICFTIFSIICYVWDFGLNIFRLIKFFNQKDYWYFGCTLTFWVIPIAVTTTRSFRFYNKGWLATNKKTFDPRDFLPKEEYTWWNWFMKWLFGFVAPIPRYCDIIKYAHKAKKAKEKDAGDDTHNIYFLAMIWEEAELLQLHQFDCFMESAPQVLLSLYIMIKDGSQFDDNNLSAICLVFSVISLSWALVSYEKKICLMKGIKRGAGEQQNPSNGIINFQTDDAIDCIKNTNLKKCALLFFAHLFTIVARLMAFSLFASVYGWVIWPACLAHLIPIFVWHRKKNYGFMDSLRLSFLHVFAYLYPTENDESNEEKHPRFFPAVYYSVFVCENVFLMIQWSQSFVKFDEGTNPGILSILYYPWNDWTFFLAWIGQIVAFISSCILFEFFNKVRQR